MYRIIYLSPNIDTFAHSFRVFWFGIAHVEFHLYMLVLRPIIHDSSCQKIPCSFKLIFQFRSILRIDQFPKVKSCEIDQPKQGPVRFLQAIISLTLNESVKVFFAFHLIIFIKV